MKSLRAESEFDAAAPQAQIRQCHHGKAETKLSRVFIERKGRKGSRKGRKENPSPRSSAPTSATSALKTRTQPHPHEIASRRIGVRRSYGYGSGRDGASLSRNEIGGRYSPNR